jgi:hypothetical protein
MRRSSPALFSTLLLAMACRSEGRSSATATSAAPTPSPKAPAAKARSASKSDAPREKVSKDDAAPPRPPPAAEQHAPATIDCKLEQVQEAFIPRQTVARAVRTTPCSVFGDCAPISPARARLRGCEDFGSHCRPLLITPALASAGAIAERIRALLDETIAGYRSDPNDCWLGSLDYTIHYNEDGILDVTFRASGMGAYPDWHTRHVALDLAKGAKLGASEFVAEKHEALAKLVNQKLERALRGVNPNILWNDEVRAFKPVNLDDFMVTREGVVFLYDFHVAHVARGQTPLREYLLSWPTVRPFINPKGALGRVRR